MKAWAGGLLGLSMVTGTPLSPPMRMSVKIGISPRKGVFWRAASALRVAVDIGGTFTDVAVFDDARGTLSFGKTLSTHGELVQGIETAVRDADAAFNEIGIGQQAGRLGTEDV